MAENKSSEKKRIRNTFDGTTGLSVMINLYVIKYIYYHIEKHESFVLKHEDGKKAKHREIYKNIIPITRQRFDRINKGYNFEMSTREATEICERFGIDIKYFRRDNPVAFEIEGIDTNLDWKCFYNERYDGKYSISGERKKEEKHQRAEKPEAVLDKLIHSDWENLLDKDDPIYKICYYFHYGERTDKPDSRKVLRELLEEIAYSEWDEIPVEELRELQNLMKRHYSYINSLVTIHKLRNE